MRRDLSRAALATALVAGALLIPAPVIPEMASAQSAAVDFAHPAMQKLWQRTDVPVQQGRAARSWVWGPAPGHSLLEPFKEGPGGMHLVQYFDKARMEVNNPTGDQNDPYFVTNGLLVVEMISGKVQQGVNTFEDIGPSTQAVAGDPGGLTYWALRKVASVGLPGQDHRAVALEPGSLYPVVALGAGGETWPSWPGPFTVNEDTILASAYVGETGHNIPNVFWNYLNSQGPVYEDGRYTTGRVFNWVGDFGYPITEAYWTNIVVGGREREVLFQAFQRRTLTYSPQNPQGWQVEMGNVGQQYYNWRYQTPSLTCQNVPVRGFGTVWAEHRNVQRGVGCPRTYPPYNAEQAVQSAYQPFQHGAMLWVNRTAYTQEQLIYVFFDDGTFQQFADTWREAQPISGGHNPPPGLYEPVRGFGKVWREGTGARVRDRLGWATAPEKGSNGAYQRFERGEMYWSGAANEIWVLYGSVQSNPQQPTGPFIYDVYADTYAP